jgi:hypothetical protein
MNWYKLAASKPKAVHLSGVLKENNGFYYLDIDTRIVAPFLNMINDDNVVHPRQVTRRSHDVGTHVSVIRDEELNGRKVKEVGERFDFRISGMEKVNPESWDDVGEVYFLTLKSEALEDLRSKYDLRRKYQGHDFHITVGVVPK